MVDFNVRRGVTAPRIDPRVENKARETRSLDPVVAERKQQIRDVMDGWEKPLEDNVRNTTWNSSPSLSTNTCGNASPKTTAILNKEGIPAQTVRTDAHVFVESKTDKGDVIVDPTIRQFFGADNAPKDMKKIFVGTKDELKQFWRDNDQYRTKKGITADQQFHEVYEEKKRVRKDSEMDSDVRAETQRLLETSPAMRSLRGESGYDR